MGDETRLDERRLSQCPSCKAARGMPFSVTEDVIRKITYTCPLCEHEWDLDVPPDPDKEAFKSKT